MPLTSKGEKILANLQEEYGAKHGKEVLYAGKNSGRFTGIDTAELDDADVDGAASWMDANKPGTNQPEPTYNREAVQRAIEASKKPISSKEAKLIHALLKGRGDATALMAKLDAVLAGASTLENRVDMIRADAMQTAHKGYLIKESIHGFHVSRDGYHITTQPTLEAAKREIDRVA